MSESSLLSLCRARTSCLMALLLSVAFAVPCFSRPFLFDVSANLPLPPAVRSYLVPRFVELVRRTYPLVDKGWIDGAISDTFAATNCSFRAYQKFGGGSGCTVGDCSVGPKRGLRTCWDMTTGAELVASEGALPGEPDAVDLKKPLSIDEGKPFAEAVVERLKEVTPYGKDMKFSGQSAPDPHLPEGEDKNVWIYSWATSSEWGSGASISVTVRARDGRVVKVQLAPSSRELCGDPKVTRAEALEKARTLPEPIDEKNLSLVVRYYFAERRLVWQYLPPGPTPSEARAWDAMTGELLESDSFKPSPLQYTRWRNPAYQFKRTEENVRTSLERNLKKLGDDMEAKKTAPKPSEGKQPVAP